MDNNNWRPNPYQGPVVGGGGGGGGGVGGGGVGAPAGGGGEAAMDSVDWRSQLQPDSRQRIINKIMETLKRHLPVSGQEGLRELRKIAVRFEEKIYTAATSQLDYLQKISLKMVTIEAGSQNPIGNALPSNSAGNSNKSPDAVMRTRRGLCYPRVFEEKNMRVVKRRRDFAAEQVSYRKRSRNSSDIAGKRDLFDALPDDLVISILCKLSSSASCPFDFANVLLTCRRLNGLVPNSLEQPDSRQRIVNKIMETLKRRLLVSGQEGLHELRKITVRFEEKVYTAATSQSDYLRKISKMLTMETKSQNPIGNALPSNSAGNSNMSPDAGLVAELLSCWNQWHGKHNWNRWSLILGCIMWIVWLEQNCRSFENMEKMLDELKVLSQPSLFEWSCCWGFTESSFLPEFLFSLRLTI